MAAMGTLRGLPLAPITPPVRPEPPHLRTWTLSTYRPPSCSQRAAGSKWGIMIIAPAPLTGIDASSTKLKSTAQSKKSLRYRPQIPFRLGAALGRSTRSTLVIHVNAKKNGANRKDKHVHVLLAILSAPIIVTITSIVALLVGIDRLPKLARAVGKMRSQFHIGQTAGGEPITASDSAKSPMHRRIERDGE